uniref:Uncharacterized protein n=1 Tax=Anguilla anguilla TaxID=7936 RepID=A0A0E9PKS5_ANGAN
MRRRWGHLGLLPSFLQEKDSE